MELKLTIQVVKPYKSQPFETWCPSSLIPIPDEEVNKVFLDGFLMDDFIEEVWDFFSEEFYDVLHDMIGAITFAPRARYSLEESDEEFMKLAFEEARKTARKYQVIYTFTDADKEEELCRSDLDVESMMMEWISSSEGDDGGSIRVGQAMINGMDRFLSAASWHAAWKEWMKPTGSPKPDNDLFSPEADEALPICTRARRQARFGSIDRSQMTMGEQKLKELAENNV